MREPLGARERKKRETRHRIGDVSARLFAEHGFDSVSMADVARDAGVSDQTIYNYFPTKPDLVLDRADEILERTRRLIADRSTDATPADVMLRLTLEDIARFAQGYPGLARGQFPALCVESDLLRRSALTFRNDQAEAIAEAIGRTDPAVHPLVARAHAAALVAVVQWVTDGIGRAVLTGSDRHTVADELRTAAESAFADADAAFRATRARATGRGT